MRAIALLLTTSALASPIAAEVSVLQISGNAVGPLRIGMTPKMLRSSARVISDRIESTEENRQRRVIRARIGVSIIEAEIYAGKVWRMEVLTSSLRTTEGFGIGTATAELLKEPGWAGGFAEGYLYMWNKKYCGLSFGLNFDPHSTFPKTGEWDQDSLAAIPGDTTVRSVLVVGR